MISKIQRVIKYFHIFAILILINSGCGGSSNSSSASSSPLSAAVATLASLPAEIQTAIDNTPTNYSFTSFVAEGSSVSYTGQIFRQVLIEDLKSFISGLSLGSYEGTAEEMYSALDSYYTYSYDNNSTAPSVISGSSTTQIQANDADGETLTFLQSGTYDSIQSEGSNLRSKTAGVDNPLRREVLYGWSDSEITTPEELIESWMQAIADQAAGSISTFTVENGDQDAQVISQAYLTADGLDYSQLLQKFLHGAVSFSQAARDYLSTDLGDTKGLNADNTEVASTGKVYTALEHHWDEGFGYFGAARDYQAYTDEQLIDDIAIDTDSDGVIDILSEWNTGLARNAASRDVGASDGTTDFTQEIISSFLNGRHLISTQPEDYMTYVEAYAVKALGEWEKVIAATVIHYINDTIEAMDAYGTADYSFTDHAKYWAEMKGFALAFQFSPVSSLSDEQFDEFHDLVADKPVLGSAGTDSLSSYRKDLLSARSILKTAFGFSAANVEGW